MSSTKCIYMYTQLIKSSNEQMNILACTDLVVFFGTAKVDEFDHTSTGDHDVGSFDVTMDDGVGVEVVKCPCDLTSVVGYCTTV